jgi:hypothetical protein
MSLNSCPIDPVPSETARVARAVFPKGNRYMTMDQRAHNVPFTTQTRLHFDVILPLWGRRGPR